MKRSMWARLLAVLLVFSMLPVNASAAMWDNWFNRKPQSSQSSTQKPGKAEKEAAKAEKEAGKKENKPGKTEKPQTPAKPEKPQAPVKPEEPQKPGQSKPGASEEILVEDVSTAENGQLLRAATFVMKSSTEAAAEELTVKYFPVTMYDYDQDTIRAATHKIEVDAGVGNVWNGMYFSGGTPAATTYVPDADVDISFDENNNALIPDGNYTIFSSANGQYVLNSVEYSDWRTYTLKATSDPAEATLWTLKTQPDGSYTIQDPTGKYMNIAGRNCANLSDEPVYMSIYKDNNGNVIVKKIDPDNDYCYLNALGGYSYSFFGGWSAGSPVSFEASENGVTLEYASHNFWAKKSGNNANGDLIYTGLVQPEMVDDQIVFNVPEAGIFNDDTAVKNIYEYVGLPFVLDKTTGVYSFDSDVHGAYFEGTPQSGTAEAPHNLHFAADAPQPMPTGLSVGDGSTNAFLPFNNQSSYTTGEVNYHFGMRADLPFSMTPNGRIKSTDDESTAISFTFSGDDDVWVFIDGHLVIDLGGIHNRLDATIDFAANTVTYSEENNADGDTATGSYNESSFAMEQSLFTMNGVEGIIPQSREAFALDPDHEMQIFYLERGEGTSNCRIEFNLPMNDTVTVTKDATNSWSQAGEDADLALNPKDENAGVDPLTDAEQAIVDNIDFGFTLYKKTAEEGAVFAPVANTNFYLVGRGVDSVIINQTDANGHFYLKNGQSAKFITEIPQAGVTYYVVEDKVPDGFISPDFTFAGEATYEYTYTDGTVSGNVADAGLIPEQIIPMPEKDSNGNYVNWPVNKSYEVTVSGSIEANDSIEFICSNFLDATLPNPTALAYEDIIVIDYGLPVRIDPLANDVFRGDNIEIVYFGNESVTLTETADDTGLVSGSWTGEQTFHSGTVTLNDVTYGSGKRDTFTYTLNKQLTEVEVISYIIKVTGKDKNDSSQTVLTQNDFAMGKIYIVPATVMYYEEDFDRMVTFTGSGWTGEVSTAGKSDFQEPGVVGTTNDSIYGSDAAYRSDSFDSNGTSFHGDTSNGAIRFTYTFTGTGTTIFARTSATTGYVQIKVYEGEGTSGKLINLTYRDTYYKDENGLDTDADGTLYNIPIFTEEFLDYGTYTVVATVAKAGTVTAGNDSGSGKDFYLDGIRVKQPLNEGANKALTEKALGAYATDGESNLDTITLRYKLINDHEQYPDTDAGEEETEWPFAVLTDVDGGIVYASDYISIGPKEEVYLNPGQSVSFAIKYWHKDGYRMHMGMKAPFGEATVKVGQTTFNLENAADCYYDITDMQSAVVTEDDGTFTATYTFTATDKIVSLTNIKITGYYEFALVEDTNVEVDGSEGEDPAGYLLEKPDEEVTEEETEEETEAPEVEDTVTETPEVEETETETPEAEDTVTETPEAEETETETPEAEETETPEVENTETVTPDIEAASTENTDAAAADVGETDVEA